MTSIQYYWLAGSRRKTRHRATPEQVKAVLAAAAAGEMLSLS
jgi:hypothetical protein